MKNMYLKIILILIYLGLLPTITTAGSACGIGVNVIDIGVPEYSDRKVLLDKLPLKDGRFGYRYSKRSTGEVVIKIHEGSSAYSAGLRVGDVILSIKKEDGSVASGDFKVGKTYVKEVIRDGSSINIEVEYAYADPVASEFARMLDSQQCLSGEYIFNPDLVPTIGRSLLSGNFRCSDAHLDLGYVETVNNLDIVRDIMGTGETSSDLPHLNTNIYFMRGGNRVILSMPFYGTRCFKNSELDTWEKINSAFVEFSRDTVEKYEKLHWANP